jgi:hypothetical protein
MYREDGQMTARQAATHDSPELAKIKWNDQHDGSAGPLGIVAGVLISLVTALWFLLIGGALMWAIIPAKAIMPVSVTLGLELTGAAAAFGYIVWTARRS